MSDSITIKSCASKEEAEVLKAVLEANGVNAMIDADDYAGLPLMTSGGVQVQVLEEDAERARMILEDLDASGGE